MKRTHALLVAQLGAESEADDVVADDLDGFFASEAATKPRVAASESDHPSTGAHEPPVAPTTPATKPAPAAQPAAPAVAPEAAPAQA